MITVPLVDLKAQYATIKPEIDEAIARVVESQRFILGPEVSALEEEIASYCDTRYAVACASGSDALLLALMAVGISAGDEVVCPSYSFFATAGSIARLGAVPVFADIDSATYNLDPVSARKAAESCSHLGAIMPVHLFGQTAAMDAFLELGGDLGVPIIEDAAQALGARDEQGAHAGSRSGIGCFSFFPSKNLGAFGDGGIITTNDPDLAERIRVLRVHGLDALQAAVLRVKLRYLERWHEGRRENAAHYDRASAAAGATVSGTPIQSGRIALQTPRPSVAKAKHVYNQYVIRVPAQLRDPLREHLKQRRIATEIYYPLGLHMQECYWYLGYSEGTLPETESAARETVALPIFPELTQEQLDQISESVVSFLQNAGGC
jgi:dTDP-4-amino-4,6-dideoxygalactose transaminase